MLSLSLQNAASFEKKDERIETKVSSKIKELLQLAASMQGIDLTSFIISCSVEKAYDVIDRSNKIYLSEAETEKLYKIMNQPPKEPTPALKALMAERKANGGNLPQL